MSSFPAATVKSGHVEMCMVCGNNFYTREDGDVCDTCLADIEFIRLDELDERSYDLIAVDTIEKYLGERCPDCGQLIHGDFGCVCS
jgi:DNA-directed RNA polymerase subunit RPC12/RpoP